MAEQARATFGGKPCFWPGSNFFALELGIAPSRGSVLMRADDVDGLALNNSALALVLEDGVGGAVTIQKLYVERVELASAGRAADPIMVEVQFHDRRQLAKFAEPVVGQFNMLREDKETYRTHSINGADPWTFDQLVQKCLDKLGWGLTAATGITWIPPNVTWEAANPASAMEQLLREVGWDVALQPDGTFTLVDVADAGATFTPSLPILTHVVRGHDRAHEKPATAEVWFRVLRQKALSCEAVMRDDGNSSLVDGSAPANAGEWRPVATIAAQWSVTEAWMASVVYSLTSPGARAVAIKKLGGGTIGAARVGRIVGELYRFFRVSETDRAKLLPLIPFLAETMTAEGRQTYMGALPGKAIDYHLLQQANEGMDTSGKPTLDLYEHLHGRPPFTVTIVDPQEGVVEFHCDKSRVAIAIPVEQKGAPGAISQDYRMEVRQVQVIAGFWKKFTDATDGSADYYIVTRHLGGKNNGGVKVFLVPEPYLREVYDPTQGAYVDENQNACDDAANGFLDGYAREFDLPASEEYVCEGVADDRLNAALRAIRWDFGQNGWRTSYRLFDDFSALRGGRAPYVKAREFAMEGERVRLVTPSTPGGSGGRGGGGGDLGSLGNEGPLLKDHGVGSRSPAQEFTEGHGGWVTDMRGDMLCAEDLTMEPSGVVPCTPQTTRTGGGVTKFGGASNPTGGGTQVTGGTKDV